MHDPVYGLPGIHLLGRSCIRPTGAFSANVDRAVGVAHLGVESDDESAMAQVRITDLLANVPGDPEAHLDVTRVEHYAQMLDALPPVVVFETAEGLLLADGYHRVAAARRRGLKEVEAEVRKGSRHDAL